MKEEMSRDEELKSLGVQLPPMQNKSAPDGYFDQLPDITLRRWKNTAREFRPRFKWLRPISIAASVLIAGGVFWWTVSKQTTYSTPSVSHEDAYAYVLSNIREFDVILEETQVYIEEEIPEIPVDAIEQYLLEEYDNGSLHSLY